MTIVNVIRQLGIDAQVSVIKVKVTVKIGGVSTQKLEFALTF